MYSKGSSSKLRYFGSVGSSKYSKSSLQTLRLEKLLADIFLDTRHSLMELHDLTDEPQDAKDKHSKLKCQSQNCKILLTYDELQLQHP